MRFRDCVYSFAKRPTTLRGGCIGLLCASALLLQPAAAQSTLAPGAGTTTKDLVAGGTSAKWEPLTGPQKAALAPLQGAWSGLSDGQRRKWLAIAKTYPELAAAEQEKMHGRMLEWAALSPKDRELARLNFAQTKTLPKSDRAATWEAYQALSAEERQKLAAAAKTKPVGAAVVLKPVAPEKLATVPVTRHTPESERAALASQRSLNRNTLLPRPVEASSESAPTDAAAKP